MPIPDTLARKITADFGAEKKYGGRKNFCDALRDFISWPLRHISLKTSQLLCGLDL